MAHYRKENESFEEQNDWKYRYWNNRLLNLYYNAYDITGFPQDKALWNKLKYYFLDCFLWGQYVGAAMDDEKGFYFGQAAPADSLTWFNSYTKYNIRTQIDNHMVTDDEGVFTLANRTHQPFNEIIKYYTKLLYFCDGAIEVNLRNQSTPALVGVAQGEELSATNKFEQIAGYKPVIYEYTKYSGDGWKYDYITPPPFIVKDVNEYKEMVLSDFYNVLGYPANSYTKQERITQGEVSATEGAQSLATANALIQMEEFIDGCNDKFGLNMEIKLSGSLGVDALDELISELEYMKFQQQTPKGERYGEEDLENKVEEKKKND